MHYMESFLGLHSVRIFLYILLRIHNWVCESVCTSIAFTCLPFYANKLLEKDTLSFSRHVLQKRTWCMAAGYTRMRCELPTIPVKSETVSGRRKSNLVGKVAEHLRLAVMLSPNPFRRRCWPHIVVLPVVYTVLCARQL